MRNIRYVLFFAITSWIGYEAHAQQDPQLTLYMFNNLYYNPAFAGAEGVIKVSAIHRSQWLGYQPTFDDGTAPQTQVLSMTAPIYRILPGASGFGFNVVNDRLGPQTNLQIQSSFAYHLGIKKSKLSIGVKLGMYSQSLDYDLYRFIDPEDPLLKNQSGKESQIRPDLSLGVLFRTEKYYAGVSFNHLLKSEFDFGVSEQRNPLENHAYLTFGYIHKVNFDVTLRPSMLVQTDFNQFNFTVGGYIDYKDKMWGGMSFRQGEDVNVLLGYNFLKDRSLGIGGSLGYIVKGQDGKQPTTVEVLINYTLPVNPHGGKKIVRTPRFRH